MRTAASCSNQGSPWFAPPPRKSALRAWNRFGRGLRNGIPSATVACTIPAMTIRSTSLPKSPTRLGAVESRGPVDPMRGLTVERVVAQGASQSAGRLGAYINAVAPLGNAFDGYVLAIYFGRGTALEVGDAVVDINAPRTSPSVMDQLRGSNLLRDDLGVPIFVVNSELEAIACLAVRQPNTDTLRIWEVAGTCHVSRQARAIRQRLLDRDGIKSVPAAAGINAIPMLPVYDAAYHHMHRWLRDGQVPPQPPLIEFDAQGDIVRDAQGIARGGLRLPQADVPLAQNSAIPLTDDIAGALGGSSRPFSRRKNLDLYQDKAAFLDRFEAAARRSVAQGVLLPRDAEHLIAEAAHEWDRAEA